MENAGVPGTAAQNTGEEVSGKLKPGTFRIESGEVPRKAGDRNYRDHLFLMFRDASRPANGDLVRVESELHCVLARGSLLGARTAETSPRLRAMDTVKDLHVYAEGDELTLRACWNEALRAAIEINKARLPFSLNDLSRSNYCRSGAKAAVNAMRMDFYAPSGYGAKSNIYDAIREKIPAAPPLAGRTLEDLRSETAQLTAELNALFHKPTDDELALIA